MLSAIIVAYRTPAEVAAAIASLQVQTRAPDEIIVVDNGAAEGEPVGRTIDAELGTKLLCPPSNLGFGAGCNFGARAAKGTNLLFLNADVVLTETSVERLEHRLSGNPRIAAVGPRIYSGGKLQPSARAFPSLRTGLLGRRSPLTRALIGTRRYPAEFRLAFGDGGVVDWVSGACLLARRSVFEALEGFDTRYWMYWEDADFCRRLADQGWSVYFDPSAVVHHATGASGTNERTIRAFHASAERFARTHMAQGRIQASIISMLLRARNQIVLRRFAAARRVR